VGRHLATRTLTWHAVSIYFGYLKFTELFHQLKRFSDGEGIPGSFGQLAQSVAYVQVNENIPVFDVCSNLKHMD